MADEKNKTYSSTNASKKFFVVELTENDDGLTVGPGGYRDSKGRLKEQFKNPRPVPNAPQPPAIRRENYPRKVYIRESQVNCKNVVTNYVGRLIFQEFIDPMLREGMSYLRDKAVDAVINLLEPTGASNINERTKDTIIDADYRDITVNKQENNFSNTSTETSYDCNKIVNFRDKAM